MHGIFIFMYEIFVENVKVSILTENFWLYDYIQNLKWDSFLIDNKHDNALTNHKKINTIMLNNEVNKDKCVYS